MQLSVCIAEILTKVTGVTFLCSPCTFDCHMPRHTFGKLVNAMHNWLTVQVG